MAHRQPISWLLLKRTDKWKPILKEPSVEDLKAIKAAGLNTPALNLLHPDSVN